MKNNFWKNKKILITGHTGFKGSWLTLILHGLGSKITGFALNPISKPNFFDGLNLSRFLHKDYRNNILNFAKLKSVILKEKPQIIFHLAAQSSVLESYKTPLSTINSNVLGTANLLEAIKFSNTVKSLVIATTDKVYLNLEEKKPFNENDKLGGHDLYSGSKAAAEIITQSFTKSFFSKKNCNIATVRSGNCIGGGDWTEDRIVKDCAEKLYQDKKLLIRMPNATRPWQHVIEPIFGYLYLAERLFYDKRYKFSGAWNFAPNLKNNLKVKELVSFGKNFFKSKSKIIISKKKHYESTNLSLSSEKAKKKLGWKNIYDAKESLRITFGWYKYYYDNTNKSKSKIITFSFNQIENYLKKLKINV